MIRLHFEQQFPVNFQFSLAIMQSALNPGHYGQTEIGLSLTIELISQ